MRTATALLILTAFLAAGCQYAAEPAITAPVAVPTSHNQKIPGKYLLYVDGSKLSRSVRPSDFNCIAHTYPVNLEAAFEQAVLLTFQNLVADLEPVATPVDKDGLAAKSAVGMISVSGETLEAKLTSIPGFLRFTVDTSVSLTASITVDGRGSGRLLGATIEGDGTGQADGGMVCEGGSKALDIASTAAVQEVTRRLGEAIANSEKVRNNR